MTPIVDNKHIYLTGITLGLLEDYGFTVNYNSNNYINRGNWLQFVYKTKEINIPNIIKTTYISLVNLEKLKIEYKNYWAMSIIKQEIQTIHEIYYCNYSNNILYCRIWVEKTNGSYWNIVALFNHALK